MILMGNHADDDDDDVDVTRDNWCLYHQLFKQSSVPSVGMKSDELHSEGFCALAKRWKSIYLI